MKAADLVGQGCIIQRPDSEGFGKHGRIVAYDPRLPFPVIVSWGVAQQSAFLLVELEPSKVML